MEKEKEAAALSEKSASGLNRLLWIGGSCVAALLYVSGLLAQWLSPAAPGSEWGTAVRRGVDFNPLACVHAAITTSAGMGMLMVLVSVVAAALMWIRLRDKKDDRFDERNFTISDKGTYGTSGWMTPDEMKEVLEVTSIRETEGTLLGLTEDKQNAISLPLSSRLNKHVAVYGASGTGKSRSFVRPQILQCVSRGESIIVTDPKGELYADAAKLCEKNGYHVRMFNLVEPKYSDAWDCLKEVIPDGDKTTDSEMAMNAQVFCDVIIKNTGGGKSDHFWDSAELSLLKALVLYICKDPHIKYEEKTLGKVYEVLTTADITQLDYQIKQLPSSHPAVAPWNFFSRSSDTVKGNVLIGLGTRLQVLQAPEIRQITGYHEIDMTLPAKEKCAYFVIMSDQNSTLDFLSSLFFSFLFIQTVKYADVFGKNGKCDVPINFILDEFPNIGQIPDFTKKLSTIRSRDLRVAVIFQNVAQLMNRYPLGLWEEILGNCDTQLFLGCTDQTTAKFISERTGEMTIEVNSTAVTKRSLAAVQEIPDYKETESVGKRYVLTPDEVMRIPNQYALVLLRGQKVLKVTKCDISYHPRQDEFEYESLRMHRPRWRQMLEEASQKSFKVEDMIFNDEQKVSEGAEVLSDAELETQGSESSQEAKPLRTPARRHVSCRKEHAQNEQASTSVREQKEESGQPSTSEQALFDAFSGFADVWDLPAAKEPSSKGTSVSKPAAAPDLSDPFAGFDDAFS